jgi:UDP-N-acetylmuramate dehydrogenase
MDTASKELGIFLKNNLSGYYLIDEPLCKHTTYHIGGPADFFVSPREQDSLVKLLHECSRLDIDFFLLGGGANILASDNGYRGVIINLENLYCDLALNGNCQINAGAGVAMKDLVLFAENKALSGLEGLSGIPGTVGGGLRMNAGTKKGEIGSCVEEVSCLDPNTMAFHSLLKEEIDFNYRSVPQLQNKIILGCTFRLIESNREELRTARIMQLNERAAKQPLSFPSCGSVFKRPPKKYYVGAMVEELGLKGLMRGDAMISDKHAGFISNLGSAKASDVMWLIQHIQEQVQKNYNIVLEPEVQMLGEIGR